MQIDGLKPELIDRLVVLESEAQHLTALAAVADAYAHVAREQADVAQGALSEIKVWIALVPAEATLELIAPKPESALPPERLGVRLLVSRSDDVRESVHDATARAALLETARRRSRHRHQPGGRLVTREDRADGRALRGGDAAGDADCERADAGAATAATEWPQFLLRPVVVR